MERERAVILGKLFDLFFVNNIDNRFIYISRSRDLEILKYIYSLK